VPVHRTLLSIPLVLAIAGCGFLSPGPSEGGGGDRLHQQAHAALARWATAVNAAKAQALVVVGEATGQVGDWEEAVGENNKEALMAGQLRPPADLPAGVPRPAVVRGRDGTSTTVDLISAGQALADIARSAAAPCSTCRALQVTDATLTTALVQTSRGPATVPIWEFGVQGTRVKLTRVAVANRISVTPPPWDANNPPEGIAIDAAEGKADARQITVSFTGSPGGAGQPCGADYSAEAVESELAVVVIVVEHRNPLPGACSAVGAERAAVVKLASPLGERAVLEVQQGLPVKLLAP
jgi:hypothetical protein